MAYAENKKAYYNYEILDTLEAGIVLRGYEVKAVREGKISIKGSFVKIVGGELVLIGAVISPYQPRNTPTHYDKERTRKLLLHKKELDRLIGKLKEKKLTMIPLKVYNKRGLVKLEVGLAKSKRKYEKREKIKKEEAKRTIERTLKTFG